jgi:type IV pilus assembly protein PilO
MAIKLPGSIDFSDLQQKLVGQFSNLDPKDPSMWPLVPRIAVFLATAIVVMVVLWFVWLSSSQELLQEEQAKELKFREDYKTKLTKAVNLDVLKKQREQVQQYVTQLEKQLPGKAEMDALLSEINQAGLGRSLQFDVFRPGQIVVKEYYAELPISIKVTGKYHDIGAFAADIANQSRIVTLNNLTISTKADVAGKSSGILTLDTTAKTFRYLDAGEISSQRKATGPKGEKK